MTRVARPPLAIAAATAAMLCLVACGGSDAKLLPGNTAEEISQNLDSVRQLVAEGECVDAQDAALEVSTEVESLEGIDQKLKQALKKGATRLSEVVDECEEAAEAIEEEALPESTEPAGKPEKQKQKNVAPEETQPAEEEAKPPVEKELPPQANGEANGHGETPPAEEEGPSGGIGPGSAAEDGG